jgi:hypothetical protein
MEHLRQDGDGQVRIRLCYVDHDSPGILIMQISRKTLLPAFGLGLAVSQNIVAAEADTWQFEVTPYLLAAGLDGTVGVAGYKADVDASFGDILDNLDGGFMGIFEAQKGPWQFGVEAVYMELGSETVKKLEGPGGILSAKGKLKATSTMKIYQGSIGYRVKDDVTKVDVIGAARYTKLATDMKVKLNFDPPVFNGSRGAKGSDSWIDGVVGMRVTHPVSDAVTLMGYADVGAGGSDLTYQFLAGANWEFKEGFAAKFGYRYLYWDYEDGGNVWDIAASGPYLGLGIRF